MVRNIRLRRPCKRCDKPFRPSSRFSYVCDKCTKARWRIAMAKRITKNGSETNNKRKN